MVRGHLVLAVSTILAGCTGGGSGSVASPPTGGGTVTPTLEVTLTPSATDQTVSEFNSAATIIVDASFTGSTTDPITPELTYDSTLLALDGPIVRSGNTFRATLRTPAALGAARYSSEIRFRLCSEAACSTVYPGSTKSFTYSLTVPIADWTTSQRNAAHTGYVHATFDPAKFVEAWTYAPPNVTTFNPIAARGGAVFTTFSLSSGLWGATSVNGATGAEQWYYGAGGWTLAGAPAVSGDQILFGAWTSPSATNTELLSLHADTKVRLRSYFIARQRSRFAQPTPFENKMFVAAGDNGNTLYGIDLITAARLWTANGTAGQIWSGSTPAVDERYVYFYSGNLDVIDRTTGRVEKSIADPNWRGNGYTYLGGPMIGSANHVIAYSSTGLDALATSFPLVDYDIAAGRQRWKTTADYTIVPATAKGVVYAATNVNRRFDAIDEATGAVLWSWPLPATETFVGNIVVTDTLAFVSTNAGVYAIELAAPHATKWSARTGGWLAIIPDGKLLVTPEPGAPSQRIVAYSLR